MYVIVFSVLFFEFFNFKINNGFSYIYVTEYRAVVKNAGKICTLS